MRRQNARTTLLVGVTIFLAILACSQGPVSDGRIPVTQIGGTVAAPGGLVSLVTPNAGSLSIAPFPTVPVHGSPTADPTRASALNPYGEYRVQPGDSLESIALRLGISLPELLAVNAGLTEESPLYAGAVVNLPAPPQTGPAYKIIPNSELIYSPTTIGFDTAGFVGAVDGYLASYSEVADGRLRTGAEIVQLVAQRYSVNPRLLLALLEHQSGWVTQARPGEHTLAFPLGHAAEEWRAGLYHQLTWSANQVNRGYYLWRAGGLSAMTLADGSIVALDPSLNAGTAGVQHFFAQHYAGDGWRAQVGSGPDGFAATYRYLFGDPFGYTFDPLLPPGLAQPALAWPFYADEGWYYTGGPHGAWDTGSGWGALDFAPPDHEGCGTSPAWVRAAAAGVIVRSDEGAVVQDLSGDGFEQTGWALFYMHMATEDRVAQGAVLAPGDPIGHPSCEGGFSNARHLHFARKYNGEWIPADGDLPFVLDGWVSGGLGSEYDGVLVNGSLRLEACDCRSESNLVQVAR
jgi:murein DD-endopeptidase MepM/ murein hydrolase activator NlpD